MSRPARESARFTCMDVAQRAGLQAGRAKGTEQPFICPRHPDKNPSLLINVKKNVWMCGPCGARGTAWALAAFVAGVNADNVRAINAWMAQHPFTNVVPMPGKTPAPAQKLIATYPYVDEHGTLLYEKRRYEPKKFHQCRPDGKGGWIFNLQGVRRVPYRLPELLEAEYVFYVEGEKDADNLRNIGLKATTAGAVGDWLPEYGELFRSHQHVVIIPDNDDAGHKHASDVAWVLSGRVSSLKILELPGLPAKGDVSDWLVGRDPDAAVEELGKLADSAREWARPQAASSEEWPAPQRVADELPPVAKFNLELLPASLRAAIADTADLMQVPADYPAAIAVLCLAGAVNRRARIQPKAVDNTWIVIPNLWGGIIAPPGLLKSPIIHRVTKSLRAIQEGWRNEHASEESAYVRDQEEFELRRGAWKETYKAASKKDRKAKSWTENPPSKPTLKRLIVNDATVEALHQTLSDNPSGVLVIRDELTGWWSQLEKHGREGERAFFLEAWNGDTGFTIDRVGRGSIHVEACCVSMLGGIQPARLRTYFHDALNDGPGNDGLSQRFQVLVWPDPPPGWKYVDRTPNAKAELAAARVFEQLAEIPTDNALQLQFDSNAQKLFEDWLTRLKNTTLRAADEHPALISHLSKYSSLMPSLALLFELADGGRRKVSLEHAQQSADWCTYLESHARRAYSCIVTPQLRAVRDLAEKIRNRKVGADGTFSLREIYLKGWSCLDTPATAKAAVDALVDSDWLREIPAEPPGPTGGRPATTRYRVNPRIFHISAKHEPSKPT